MVDYRINPMNIQQGISGLSTGLRAMQKRNALEKQQRLQDEDDQAVAMALESGKPEQIRGLLATTPNANKLTQNLALDEASKMERQQVGQQFNEALQNNDHQTISKLSLQYPEIGKTANELLNHKNEMSRENYLDTLGEIAANKGNIPAQRAAIQARYDYLESIGAEPSHTLEALNESNQNVDLYDTAMSLLAAKDNKRYDAIMKSMNAGKLTPYQQATEKRASIEFDRRMKLEERKLAALESKKTKAQTPEAKALADEKLKEQKLKVQALEQKSAEAKKAKKDEAEKAYTSATDTLNLVDSILNHPGLNSAFGIDNLFPDLPGGDSAAVKGLIDTLQSQNYLQSVQALKGMGALSDAEGKKLSSAIASLDYNMSNDAARKAINTIRAITQRAKGKAEKNLKDNGFEVPEVENIYQAGGVEPGQPQKIGGYTVTEVK